MGFGMGVGSLVPKPLPLPCGRWGRCKKIAFGAENRGCQNHQQHLLATSWYDAGMDETAEPKRRWYQFYLWHLFVLTTLSAIVCSACTMHPIYGVVLFLSLLVVFGNVVAILAFLVPDMLEMLAVTLSKLFVAGVAVCAGFILVSFVRQNPFLLIPGGVCIVTGFVLGYRVVRSLWKKVFSQGK